MKIRSRSAFTGALVAALAAGAMSAPARAATASPAVAAGLALSVAVGPPTQVLAVTGAGFAATEAVDVYLGTTDLALGVTAADGTLTVPGLTIPASAQPGRAWVTAVGRRSGLAAQTPFLVRTDWPQQAYGPARTGTNPYENTLSPATVAGMGRRWASPTGSGGDGVVVAGGVVYGGTSTGGVYALDATTGTRLWTFTAGDWVTTVPAVAGGLVYVGSDDSNLYALDAATGAKRWSFTAGDSVESAPAVAGGVVYFGSYDGNVYALDAATGAKRWSYATGAYVYAAPAVADGVVYVAADLPSGAQGTILALDAATGAKRWSFVVTGVVRYPPAVLNGRLFFASPSSVYALNTGGAQIWRTQTPVSSFSGVTVAGGSVYFGTPPGEAVALNAATGTQRWRTSLTAPYSLYSPAVADGVVYIGTRSSPMFALDAATGTTLWTYDNAYGFDTIPLVTDGTLFVMGRDDLTYAFALPTSPSTKATPKVDPKTLHPNPSLKPPNP